MASITREPNGRKTIQFVGADKKRRSIRIGRVPLRTAESVKVRFEHLVAASVTGHAVDAETARWLIGLDGSIRDSLVAVGLVPKREAATLAAFIDSYISGRTDLKPNSVIHLGQTQRSLVEFFGADRPMKSITAGDADTWRLKLIERGLANDTVRRRCGVAKQFFGLPSDAS